MKWENVSPNLSWTVENKFTFNNDFMMNREVNFSVNRNEYAYGKGNRLWACTYLLVGDLIFKSKLSRSSCRNEY